MDQASHAVEQGAGRPVAIGAGRNGSAPAERRLTLAILCFGLGLVAGGVLAEAWPIIWLGIFTLGCLFIDLLAWLYETRPVKHREASLSLLNRDHERIGL